MSAQNQVDSLDVLGQLYIVVLHHMSQCNDHLALVGLLQPSDHVICELQKVNVVAKLFIKRVKRVDPLLFCQTEKTNLDSVLLDDFKLQAICQSFLGSFVKYI